MSSGQQVIKVLAIILAIFLIVNIFGWIIVGISTFIGIDMLGDVFSKETGNTIEFSQVYNEPINSMKIETAISKLTIKKGTQLKVEGSNLPSMFRAKVTGSTLVVKEEENKNWINQDISSELIITIPEQKVFDSITIELGIGNNSINDITTNKLKLECGVGVTQMNHITVLSETNIDGGAGRTTIQESSFNYLDLDAGVGEITISADVTGNSKVDCGVGRLELNLLRPEKDYSIRTSTGLGKMTLNGKKCNDSNIYGTGEEKLRISGGVGAVEITTLEN